MLLVLVCSKAHQCWGGVDELLNAKLVRRANMDPLAGDHETQM